MTSGPQVRDFTQPGKSLAVELEVSPVYELVLSLFTYDAGADLAAVEGPPPLAASVREHAGPELIAELDRLKSCGEVWLPLIGIAYAHGATDTIDAFLDLLEATDPVALRRRMIRNSSVGHREGATDLIDPAAAGDEGAIAELTGNDHPGIAHLLRLAPEDTRAYLAGLVRRFHDEVFSKTPSTLPILERDAAEKRILASTTAPERLVERATNGVTFRPEPGVAGVVLIPSVVVRPWVVITDHDGVRIFCYPVADEHLVADPDSPPSYLVEFYKALGDEKRLHILSMLAEGPAGLQDLAQRLDLAKSTIHHHLRMLRSAGLVRVTVGEDDKAYSLRTETLPQAGIMLQAFLSGRRELERGAE